MAWIGEDAAVVRTPYPDQGPPTTGSLPALWDDTGAPRAPPTPDTVSPVTKSRIAAVVTVEIRRFGDAILGISGATGLTVINLRTPAREGGAGDRNPRVQPGLSPGRGSRGERVQPESSGGPKCSSLFGIGSIVWTVRGGWNRRRGVEVRIPFHLPGMKRTQRTFARSLGCLLLRFPRQPGVLHPGLCLGCSLLSGLCRGALRMDYQSLGEGMQRNPGTRLPDGDDSGPRCSGPAEPAIASSVG